MQVSHQQDFDTHAIMGGGEVMEFGVAQTAEFFTVLSSTLYSNKSLAVIREVLCNAWDAHIVSNRTHIPVEIEITDTEISITDHGFGIPHDMIQPIYCVYGNSTKANDGLQTGGFGLGSKAPFAYSDHFSVISTHGGKRTVYALSRGSSKTQGKPDCRVMVDFPSMDSGLTVKIPLKNAEDGRNFKKIAYKIARFGEMNVTINGDKVDTLPISNGQEGYYLTREEIDQDSDNHMFVRYGNVIYPIPYHEEYAAGYTDVKQFVEKLSADRYNTWSIVFQAPANKISVTPSRESLNLSDVTIETLKELFGKIPSISSDRFKSVAQNYIQERIQSLWNQGQEAHLLRFENMKRVSLLLHTNSTSKNVKEIVDYETAVQFILYYNHPDVWEFLKWDMNQRIDSFIAKGRNVHLMKAVKAKIAKLEEAPGSYGSCYYEDEKHWMEFGTRQILAPLVKKILRDDTVSTKNLTVYAHARNKKTGNFRDDFVSVTEYKMTANDVLSFMNNAIVVTSSRASIKDEAQYNTDISKGFGTYMPILVYIAPRTKGGQAAAVSFFQKLGMTVIDHDDYVTKKYAVSGPPVKLTPISKPKVVGIPVMSELVSEHGRFNPRGHLNAGVKRIEKPEFVFQPHRLSGASYHHNFFKFGDKFGVQIVKHFGHLGGIAVNSKQLQSYIDKGCKDGYDWLCEHMLEEFQTSQRLQDIIAFKLAPWSVKATHFNALFHLSKHSQTIKDALGFPEAPTEKENLILHLWEEARPAEPGEYHPSCRFGQKYNEIVDFIKTIPINPDSVELSKKLDNSPLIKCLDMHHLLSELRSNRTPQKQKDDIETLLLLALEG